VTRREEGCVGPHHRTGDELRSVSPTAGLEPPPERGGPNLHLGQPFARFHVGRLPAPLGLRRRARRAPSVRPGSNYLLTAAVTASRIDGSRAAVTSTQTDPAHYYQRPDGTLDVDTTRTSLSGDAETIHLAKYGGGIVVFETSYQRISPGYEINDLGFLNRADWQDQSTWVGLQFLRRTKFYNQLDWNFNEWQDWTSAGDLQLERAVNTNLHVQFHNNWYAHAGGPSASSEPRSPIAPRAADRRCVNRRTRRPGSRSRATSAACSTRTCSRRSSAATRGTRARRS
jgi:hypothetical protein